MMQMNIAEAKAKLSELIAAAELGQEVVIARGAILLCVLSQFNARRFVLVLAMGLLRGFRISWSQCQKMS